MNEASGWRWLPVTAAVIGLDQFSKLLVVHHVKLYSSIYVLPVLDISLRYNRGAAFSFLEGASGWQRWFFTVLALIVSATILIWMRRLRGAAQWLLCLSLAFILAGALGNMIDRLRIGHVIDFVVAHWHHAEFPAFNLADSSITVGAALLLLDALLDSRRTAGAA
ncbi:MAG TPA: signal peptidase II [Steroidobacteraceae bacterium]|nr:signal peptidase II [Steroidobacteraceae bacterium]